MSDSLDTVKVYEPKLNLKGVEFDKGYSFSVWSENKFGESAKSLKTCIL